MTRCYDEPVEVRRRDDVPEQFLWRGRLYAVRAVLARWVEAGGWWRESGPGLEDPERELWRVEASPGRGAGVSVVDLCFDWRAGVWSLARALD